VLRHRQSSEFRFDFYFASDLVLSSFSIFFALGILVEICLVLERVSKTEGDLLDVSLKVKGICCMWV
jgi:hypothetical protein